MSNRDWNDPDPAEDAWKRAMLDARQGARGALAECSAPHIDNWQAVEAPQIVQFCHAKTMDYYRHISPKAPGLPDELWREQVTAVRVPRSQQIEAGITNWYGEYELDGILSKAGWVEKPVTLDTLREEWQEQSTVDIEVLIDDRATGQVQHELQRFDIHLPPAACEAVIQRLDKCLDDLKWLPEAGEYTIEADDLEVLE